MKRLTSDKDGWDNFVAVLVTFKVFQELITVSAFTRNIPHEQLVRVIENNYKKTYMNSFRCWSTEFATIMVKLRYIMV